MKHSIYIFFIPSIVIVSSQVDDTIHVVDVENGKSVSFLPTERDVFCGKEQLNFKEGKFCCCSDTNFTHFDTSGNATFTCNQGTILFQNHSCNGHCVTFSHERCPNYPFCFLKSNYCDGKRPKCPKNEDSFKFCDTSMVNYPDYNASTKTCGIIAKVCPRNENARHQNNQCYENSLSNANRRYVCLNRQNIHELQIKYSIISTNINVRYNFFRLFQDINSTHFSCGRTTISKKCLYLTDPDEYIECDVENDKKVFVERKDICLDFAFIKHFKFPEEEIRQAYQTFKFMVRDKVFNCTLTVSNITRGKSF